MDIERSQKQQGSYNIPFCYILDGKLIQSMTKFGLKTVGELLKQVSTKQSLMAFDDQYKFTMLANNYLLKSRENKPIHIFDVQQQNNMIYLHVYFQSEITSYYVDREMKLLEFADIYNKDDSHKNKITQKTTVFLSNRLEPGTQVRQDMWDYSFAKLSLTGNEECIMQLIPQG